MKIEDYDIRICGGFFVSYIGNDVNGNCKYAVNFKVFLKPEEIKLNSVKECYELAKKRAKKAGWTGEKKGVEPYFYCKPSGNLGLYTKAIYDVLESE